MDAVRTVLSSNSRSDGSSNDDAVRRNPTTLLRRLGGDGESTTRPGGWLPFSFVVLLSFYAGLLPFCWASHHTTPWRYRIAAAQTQTTQLPTAGQPYRTAFHFQPMKNWMNDPNGPMFYKGYYHLFYQYNPYGAEWGNIVWSHVVSKDLISWHHLEEALVPDHWYDIRGCWSGSATFLADGKPVILYTGWTNVSHQVQNMAVPADPADPLLRKWVKIPENPIAVAPLGTNNSDFRDPTTAWKGEDGQWRILVGSKRKHRGLAFVYKSSDFVHWKKAKHPLHSVPNTGMWECPDFYPVPVNGKNGLDTSVVGFAVKHVLKVSLDNTKHDHYAVGTYVASADAFVPTNPSKDVGIGLRYDYGKFYASRTFYDINKRRRILLGWTNESDSTADDNAKGWSGVHVIPRMVWLDNKTGDSLLQWPVEELEGFRGKKTSIENLQLQSGSVVEVKGVQGNQLDVQISFEISDLEHAEKADITEENAQMICSGEGAAAKGVVGPFGLLVLAAKDLQEQTAVFFHVFSSKDGWKALVCSDQSRSSLASNLDKTSYGTFIPLSRYDNSLSMRTLVDHSIVETFAQGGKRCITSRVYPIMAINSASHLFVFNNGTRAIQVRSLVAWEMASVRID